MSLGSFTPSADILITKIVLTKMTAVSAAVAMSMIDVATAGRKMGGTTGNIMSQKSSKYAKTEQNYQKSPHDGPNLSFLMPIL